MATSMAMEKPPMPPEVAAQMAGGGAPPFAGVGGMMADQQKAGNPLKTALDATTKLWANVVKGNPKLGPYVERAIAILNAGLQEAANAASGGSQGGGEVPPPGPSAGQMPA